jgi:hypothetical protein
VASTRTGPFIAEPVINEIHIHKGRLIAAASTDKLNSRAILLLIVLGLVAILLVIAGKLGRPKANP